MLRRPNGIYINHTLFEVLHCDFLFSTQGGDRVASSRCLQVKFKKRSCLKSWDKENMIKAVKAVRNKEMGYLAAAKLYNVPRSTL